MGRRTVFIAAAAGALALFVQGCFGEEITPFPPGLEPLETENLSPGPAARDGEPYPEELVMVRSFAPDIVRTHAIHARGYLHAPLSVVWEALRNPDVGADRRTFASWSTTYDVEPAYDYSYVIHSVIVNVITVEYDVTWRHGVVEGTLEAPTLAAARFQKTAGSTAISDLRGSFVLTEVAPGVTEIQIIEYLRAVSSSHENIESFLSDVFAELLVLSHGGTLPPIGEL